MKTLTIITLIAYPFLVYFGLGHLDMRWIAAGLMAALVLRALMLPAQYRYRMWGMTAIGVVIAALVFIFHDPLYLKLYPVMMSVFMLGIFSYSLYVPPSIIETFARMGFKNQDLPAHVVIYTRKVTQIWCLFFIINGLIALWSTFQSLEIWTLYNGFISYVLMGLLLSGEFIYRHLIVKKRNQSEP